MKQKTILVIEDEHLLLQAITKKLEIKGLHSVACDTAEKGLAYLEKTEHIPDAIWLDYNLPDMNGLAFMGNLKQNSEWERIPVVVVSNSISDEKTKGMLLLGAKDYLLKAEHRLEEIIDIISQYIQDKK